jgi:hypothetical protein
MFIYGALLHESQDMHYGEHKFVNNTCLFHLVTHYDTYRRHSIVEEPGRKQITVIRAFGMAGRELKASYVVRRLVS